MPTKEHPNATSALAASTRAARNAVPPMALLVRQVERVLLVSLETLVTLANRVMLVPEVTRELMATKVPMVLQEARELPAVKDLRAKRATKELLVTRALPDLLVIKVSRAQREPMAKLVIKENMAISERRARSVLTVLKVSLVALVTKALTERKDQLVRVAPTVKLATTVTPETRVMSALLAHLVKTALPVPMVRMEVQERLVLSAPSDLVASLATRVRKALMELSVFLASLV